MCASAGAPITGKRFNTEPRSEMPSTAPTFYLDHPNPRIGLQGRGTLQQRAVEAIGVVNVRRSGGTACVTLTNGSENGRIRWRLNRDANRASSGVVSGRSNGETSGA